MKSMKRLKLVFLAILALNFLGVMIYSGYRVWSENAAEYGGEAFYSGDTDGAAPGGRTADAEDEDGAEPETPADTGGDAEESAAEKDYIIITAN